MKNLLWLLASLAWVGCIPVVTGAPCETDANCPDTQRCGTKRVCEARTGSGGGPATGGSGGGDITGGGGGTFSVDEESPQPTSQAVTRTIRQRNWTDDERKTTTMAGLLATAAVLA